MLDGLLGRGFSVKCKSLIKATRARIEVLRRRAEAKQRFLKEDLAKLLSNGLDINAYGRTEEFLAGMNLLACYDFVEKSCDYIVKQLSRMQKQGECPEDCREAVGSLMFAAARFSDMPELRDLRDIFQQRYGSCLEAFVNQKFVEKLSSRPPETEKRLQVLQDIASEFSIRWDPRGFELRMTTSIVAQAEVQKADIAKQRPRPLDEKSTIHNYGEGNDIRGRHETDHQISGRKETIEYKDPSLLKRGGSSLQGDNDVLYRGRHTLTENKHPYPVEKGHMEEMKIETSSSSSQGKMMDRVHPGYMRPNNGACNLRQEERSEALLREKGEYNPRRAENLGKTDKVISSYDYSNQSNALNSIRKEQEEGSDKLKSCSSYALPPPYVKSKDNMARPPYVKPKEDKDRQSRGSKHAASDQAGRDGSNFVSGSGMPRKGPDHHDYEEQLVATSKVRNYGHENKHDYEDEKLPLPKPRSIRRKHHKSSSNSDIVDTLEDVGTVNRSSSSRRKDHSRKGLHILFDEEHNRKDDEERMIDKLLIHYSRKPSTYDARKLRKKLPGHPSHQIISDVGESSLDQRRDAHDVKYEAAMVPPPTRSVSLPKEQTASPETKKVFSRANTFQPDNHARHVHPKLPDYDDLAARFAALKGR
ncbi:Spindle pole body protein [Handroanthus impetiginosus]|uniref:Spindle pole body protein n=1 Tax=Handroanthus impetiginosus TaxID=429701 RepID=A0A2G9GZS6_9LAMI|nr:Spindle pole body protein [Handroanthus impetiginosus]